MNKINDIDFTNIRVGVDVDNTLTYEKLPRVSLEETRQFIRNVEPRQGIEILNILNVNPWIITGRGTYFENDTAYWLNKVNINYRSLCTVDRTEELDFWEYIEYKVNAYVQNKIEYCIEDDIRVTQALEKANVKCSLVQGDENFEDAFIRLFED